MKTNFVLIDFENVQPKNMSILEGRSFKVKVFAGTNQTKVPMEMVRALQPFGSDAEYVEIAGNGKNALDFHIAYYVGRLATATPGASFYVISRDKGFDPLIKHVKAQGITCVRLSSIADIPGGRITGSQPVSDTGDSKRLVDTRSTPDKVDAIIADLVRRKAARPKKLKALRATINQLFKNKLTDVELDGFVDKLTKRGVAKIVDGKVSYELS